MPNQWVTPGLSAHERRRRVWHMTPGLLPFVLWPIPHRDPISPTLYTILVVIVAILAGSIFARYRRIERDGEHDQRFWAVAGYAGSVLLTFLLFPGHAELGMTVLAILAFGDGSATLGSKLIGGPRLPWNSEKSIAGTLCFLLVGIPMSAIIYWGEANNLEALPQSVPVTLSVAFLIGGAATATSALAESISSRINDNVRVGVTAAFTLAVVQGLIVGWS